VLLGESVIGGLPVAVGDKSRPGVISTWSRRLACDGESAVVNCTPGVPLNRSRTIHRFQRKA